MGNGESGRGKIGRPLGGTISGIVAGLGLAIVLQQSGVWPLDRLLLFGLPGLLALIALVACRLGREVSSSGTTIIAGLLALGLLAFGLTGVGAFGESGELNGGCKVTATSDLDQTDVVDTSRSDPFEIDPDGRLSWTASSSGPITEHEWEIYVDVGGFQLVVADGGDPNSALTVESQGDEDVSTYAEDIEDVARVTLSGVYEVGGFIAGTGGACDGFGFVLIAGGGPVSGPIAIAGLVLAVIGLALIAWMCLGSSRR